jgi:hypothetical protein
MARVPLQDHSRQASTLTKERFAAICSDLQRFAAICSDLQRFAAICSDLQRFAAITRTRQPQDLKFLIGN